jgi:hypothetical protein
MIQDETAESDDLAQLARVIHDQMTVEPRRMHDAIVMARRYMEDIRRNLVEQGMRDHENAQTAPLKV